MRKRRVVLLGLAVAALVFAGRKKNPDDTTQVLDLPKDPPLVAIGDTSRLVFHVSPLSAKGLLTQQTRDALKAILKMNGGAPVVHIRAFVAGSGDVRRVPQIASEVFTEKKMPLPSVSVIQIGELPLEGAQVVLETVSEAKKPVNTDGLSFMGATSSDVVGMPLAVTCYVSSLASAGTIASRFAGAAVDVVQTLRAPGSAAPQCEAIARGGNTKAAKLAFTGTQVALGTDEKSMLVAFQRMDRNLTEAGVQPADIVVTHLYPLSARIGEAAKTIRNTRSPLSVVTVEGVAGIDGAFAVDAIAALN